MIQKTRFALVYILKNPMYIIIHFGCWFLLSAILTLPYQSKNYLQYLIEGIPIICIIAFISSYREVRGKLRGSFKTHNIWTNWYNQQLSNMDQSHNYDNPPTLAYTQNDTLYYRVKTVLISLFREPIPLFIHFGVWSIASLTGIYLDDPMQADILGGTSINRLLEDLISEYWENILFILPIALITCLLEVKGYISGITKKHQENTDWFYRHINGTKVNESLEFPIFDTNTQKINSITIYISRYLILQFGLGILLYISISFILGAIGIVDNPNFFLRYLCIALFIVI